jgi:hypothetical protein
MMNGISYTRGIFASLAIALLAISLTGCPSKSSSASGAGGNLDGVWHSPNGGPMTLTIKDGKATMLVANESKTLDYKVEGNKLTLIDPKEGNVVFTINDDGTLNSEIGVLQRSPK